MAESDFQCTLTNILSRHHMSLANLAEQTGYHTLLVENLVAGESREIPVDFFTRVADTLDLTTDEKDELIRSWAFGIEKRNWRVYSA